MRRIARVLGYFFCCISLHAESSPIARENEGLDATYLYSATAPSGQVAYLFGSSHKGHASLPIKMGQCAKDAVTASSTVVMEADPIAATSFGLTQPSTVPMAEVVPRLQGEHVRVLNRIFFNAAGTEPDPRLLSLDWMRVSPVLAGLRSQRLLKSLGIPVPGLDTEVAMAARFLNKPIGFLETPEEQFRHLKTAVSPEFAARDIQNALAALSTPDADIEFARKLTSFLQAAAAGDEPLLASLEGEQEASITELFVAARNPSQAEKIDSWMRGGAKPPVFFALGALHLPGPQGVPALLAAKGYRVERMCPGVGKPPKTVTSKAGAPR